MKQVLLLHGAIGAKDQLVPLEHLLAGGYEVYSMNFNGHGGSAFSGKEFCIADFATEVLQFINEKKLIKPWIFGYSMGGYVALYLSLQHPGILSGIITLATKFTWTPGIAAKEITMLDPLKIATKIPAFAAELEQRHLPNHWQEVLNKTAGMMIRIGAHNPLPSTGYRKLQLPVMLLLGDSDRMVSLSETQSVAAAIPGSKFCILPDTGHPLDKVDTKELAGIISKFIEDNNIIS